jgi:pimeloyl-ACP methyl ester carboxylesterase
VTAHPWTAPPSATLDAIAEQTGRAMVQTVRAAYADGYADGWHAGQREAATRVAALDRRVTAMSIDAAGEAGRVAYLRGEVDRLAPEAAQARTLAAALARAETEVQSLRREVEHLKKLAGLPEGM